jgi:uncharacterized protein
VETLSTREARRLALARAGLLQPERTGLPRRASGGDARARHAAQAVVERFGYLQLDTVSIAGARSHAIVLLSRLDGLDPALGESLLRPRRAAVRVLGPRGLSWIPLDLYPAFEFRRREFRHHPWWGDVVGEHPRVARDLLQRIRDEGPLRSLDLEGDGEPRLVGPQAVAKLAAALWSSGELAIRERRAFQRTFDLAERVIPPALRRAGCPTSEALELLLLRALDGHGWATTARSPPPGGCATGAPRSRPRCAGSSSAGRGGRLRAGGGGGPPTPRAGSARRDRELAGRLATVRPRADRGVLLSPFDPLLWDRGARGSGCSASHQVLEIFKPAPATAVRLLLPAGARRRAPGGAFDLKAERRRRGACDVLSCRYEGERAGGAPSATAAAAVSTALARYASALGLEARPPT